MSRANPPDPSKSAPKGPKHNKVDLPFTNVSSDLVWEATNRNSAFLIKRKSAGGVQLSRDPLNLLNKHSRKHAGFVNQCGIGVQAHPSKLGAVVLTTKKEDEDAQYHPRTAYNREVFNASTPSRKIFRQIANETARKDYRPDLLPSAIRRASAIKLSQKPKREGKPKRPGGLGRRALKAQGKKKGEA